MNENQLGKGAIKINPIHRFLNRKLMRKKFPKTGRGIGVDWNTGYDVRNIIGPIVIKNQGQNSSCGGQAGAYFLEIQRRLQKITEGPISAKSIYSLIAYPGGGTTIPALEKQLCASGANLEATVPSEIEGAPLSEGLITDTSWETTALTQDARNRAGYTPYDVTIDIDFAASVIEQYGACIMEIEGQNGHIPGWQSQFPQSPSKDNPNEIWDHFMCLIGYQLVDSKKYLIGLQSEGSTWGLNGVQFFSEEYVKSGYIKDIFTLIYDTRLIPNSDNFSPWAFLLRFFRLSWGLSLNKL